MPQIFDVCICWWLCRRTQGGNAGGRELCGTGCLSLATRSCRASRSRQRARVPMLDAFDGKADGFYFKEMDWMSSGKPLSSLLRQGPRHWAACLSAIGQERSTVQTKTMESSDWPSTKVASMIFSMSVFMFAMSVVFVFDSKTLVLRTHNGRHLHKTKLFVIEVAFGPRADLER